MNKPRLLDLFCGAGGTSMGYHLAGFEVIGVDIAPQPHYPFLFKEEDALTSVEMFKNGVVQRFKSHDNHWGMFDLNDIAAIHASPPCQAYSISRSMQGTKGSELLIDKCRDLLTSLGKPFVIENVPGAPLNEPIELSGMSFGLKIIRRRLFELHGFDILLIPSPRQVRNYRAEGYLPYHHGTSTKRGHLPNIWTKPRLEKAMGIDWMNVKELTQAIPPAYTEYIGKYLLEAVRIPQLGYSVT